MHRPEAPLAYAVQGDESVLEEWLQHHGEVLTLKVLLLVGQPGDATLWMGTETAQTSGEAGRTGPGPAALGWL